MFEWYDPIFELIIGHARTVGAYQNRFALRRFRKWPVIRRFKKEPALDGPIIEDIRFLSTQQTSYEFTIRPFVSAVLNFALVLSTPPSKFQTLAKYGLLLFVHGSWLFKFIWSWRVYFSANIDYHNSEPAAGLKNAFDFENIEDFEHTTIHDQSGFRCLLLKASPNEGAVIQCEIFSISVQTPPIYEALSYAWGSSTTKNYILCNGKKLSVSENCIAALYTLRQRTCHRLLWIDAICIDQTNIAEANQQVQIMGSIYRNAAKVIIWLGPGTAESRLGFQYLNLLTSLQWVPGVIEKQVQEWIVRKIRNRGHSNSVLGLHHRSWFSRMWTIQEVALAKQGSCVFQCGKSTANYDWGNIKLFELCVSLSASHDFPLNELLYKQTTLFRTQLRSRVLFGTKSTNGYIIGDLLRYLTTYGATDPKDKIFGLYGVLGTMGIAMPLPDYNDELGYIYWSAMVAIISQEVSLNFLSMASGVDSKIPTVSSWVPDFRKINSFMNMDGRVQATKESTPMCWTQNRDSELHVRGIVVDKILSHSTYTPWEPPFGTLEVQDDLYFGLDDFEKCLPTIVALQDWIAIGITQGSRVASRYGDAYMPFMKVITLDNLNFVSCGVREFAEWTSVLMAYAAWNKQDSESSEVEEQFRQASTDPESRHRFFDNPDCEPMTKYAWWKAMFVMKANPNISRVFHLAWAVARGNTMFETETGYLGLAPKSLADDDVVALIQGVRMPTVLRPVLGTGERRFMVVGPAYVHGMMAGELWDDAEGQLEDLILV